MFCPMPESTSSKDVCKTLRRCQKDIGATLKKLILVMCGPIGASKRIVKVINNNRIKDQ